ncbi:MAG: glycosyltransferase family 2 protein [Bacteroidota bacterium]
MYISGFTIARNVVKADYPIREAIYSILPLCDEVVVAVGKSEDTTLEYIKSFNEPKIRIIETIWDDTLREGGKVLAVETNKAMAAINPKADWCFYIQADECLDDTTINSLKTQLEKYKDEQTVEGLLFDYRHFYGSYDYVADSRTWYRHEIRVVKNLKGISSYKDAQGFRIDGRKLNVKKANATINHYGWVKNPSLQLEKLKQARKLWHSDEFLEKEYASVEAFDFSEVDSLKKYTGTHPLVMQPRIAQQNWQFEYDISRKNMGLKMRILYAIEQLTGYRVGEYKNYRLL